MTVSHHDCATPFGPVRLPVLATAQQRAALLHNTRDPRAALYAAKTLGLTRVVEVVTAAALDRLLPARALALPHDLVDLTVARAATFFVDKGYGFLGQQQVFCPDLRQALIDAADPADRPVFARGTLAVIDPPLAALDRRWGAQLIAESGAPAAYLAKELELCYAPLCILGPPPDDQALITRALAQLPAARACPCATAMQLTRARGLIGDDWRTWIG